MFQSFATRSDPTTGRPRLAVLREQLAAMGLDGFVVPHADAHQNEYLPPHAERLAWLTGFTGSAGTAVVLTDTAHVFVDGRYTLQLRQQADMNVFTPQSLTDTPPHQWLADNLAKGTRLGFDPWLHTIGEAKRLEQACAKADAELIAVSDNPVDAVWADAPPPPAAPVRLHPIERAGKSAKAKLRAMARTVRQAGAAATVLTDPASVCWAFNIRGADVVHTPLALAWAIVPARGAPQLFIDPAKHAGAVTDHLRDHADLQSPEAFEAALSDLGRTATRPVMLDPARAAAAIAAIVEDAGGTVIEGTDPAVLPRAAKNRSERKGAVEAHRRDGAAMATFLAWLDAQDPASLNEIAIVEKLERVRTETGERLGMPLREIAFDTICGAGPHGAIVHYRVDEKSNRAVAPGDLILIDSGAQYEDGTTDITRVIATGEASEDQRHHFTLVLKGMIAMSQARFPEGTRGVDLDVLARRPLWAAGLDYGHGTGHGVGSYLGVHEGPQNLSRRGMAVLEEGMIVSNEPGYYVEGSHGIRIENLVMVAPAKVPEGGEKPMHAFTTLTLCPIDRRLIAPKLLDRAERRWLNRYHARVRRELSKLIDDPAVLGWLERATAPVR
ncbi:aminopeptidase P family protein [Roseitalea porphyridii]|uniref:Aminopeptidase P family protein n=1 Tax=Roseitalea porphyridii TaxID=1852022 RepID=A0A4V1A459_9HYPH|nr:aminopeptidase P family protein [Roseitalea porphyridii]QBK31478.1 aminopeptidase P family protein [Roseitalea porphyridii]